jgi:radical SAM superfamily enzyme YgiQ (UPF0313 family)
MEHAPHILCVNPWIHDFAAYDFWSKPLGLLTLAARLRQHRCKVSYVDCLDRFHPRMPPTDPSARCGRGPFLKTRIPKPDVFKDIPRHYCRYGIKPAWLRENLAVLPKPDLVLVTSIMTYWYPGVRETIDVVRDVYGDIPVILGGVYPTLYKEHSLRFSGADRVVGGPGESRLFELIDEFTDYQIESRSDPDWSDAAPYPAFDLQRCINYIPILTSRGCPFSCAYCASHILNPVRMQRDPDQVVAEILFWHERHGVIDFVFYDDALLMDAGNHAHTILEGIVRSQIKIRFHTPNALHIRWIGADTARLMRQSGFTTVRLGLETAGFDDRQELDSKVTATEFGRAVTCLKNAGFESHQIGAYLLAGLPGQSLADVEASIKTVKENGITPVVAYYSPIPQTRLWPRAVATSRYDLESDPIFTNNAILPCQKDPFSWETVSYLKNLTV